MIRHTSVRPGCPGDSGDVLRDILRPTGRRRSPYPVKALLDSVNENGPGRGPGRPQSERYRYFFTCCLGKASTTNTSKAWGCPTCSSLPLTRR